MGKSIKAKQKETVKVPNAVADVKGKGKAVSEIDDIFSGGGGKAKVQAEAKEPAKTTLDGDASEGAAAAQAKTSKAKRKKKKQERDPAAVAEDKVSNAEAKAEPNVTKQPVTIVDTSSLPPKAPAKAPTAATSKPGKRKRDPADANDRAAKAAEADDLFRDSRGTSNRRKTDDGLAIYDISELGIGKGGDTPLCPFDCECCF